MGEYASDIVNGEPVPPLVVTSDCVVQGLHQGAIHVESAHCVLRGTHQGSLHLHLGASAELAGAHQGSVHLDSECQARVTGDLLGSAHLAPGSTLVVEPKGLHAGSVHNEGTYVLRGELAGSRHGEGVFVVEGSGHVRQPRIVNGARVYDL